MSSFLLLCFLKVEDVVVALDESLRPAASGIAMKLRSAGRRVELVLEAKKMKWAIKVGDYAELERAHVTVSLACLKNWLRLLTLAKNVSLYAFVMSCITAAQQQQHLRWACCNCVIKSRSAILDQ